MPMIRDINIFFYLKLFIQFEIENENKNKYVIEIRTKKNLVNTT